MLTIHINKSADGLVDYFTNALSQDDYFFSGKSTPGRWHGTLAQDLGLPEKVSKKDFSSLAHNRHPKTGERLTGRNNAARRTSIEYTFSAPKSVSLLMALSEENGKEILNAHRLAVKKAMQAIEADMHTQTRIEGRNTYAKTGNIVYARFDHFSSRPMADPHNPHSPVTSDPQLHSHCIVMNCTKFGDRYQALEGSPIHRVAGYYEAIYHAHLSGALQKLGYRISRTNDRWEIHSPGMTRRTLEKFSRRTMQIEALAKARGITNAKTKGALGAKTRLHKRQQNTGLDLKAIWQNRLTALEAKGIETAKGDVRPPLHPITPEVALERSLAHHLERQSAVPAKKLLGHALSLGYGSFLPKDIHRALERRKDILYARRGAVDYLTTKAMVRAENRMIDFAAQGKNTYAPLHPDYEIKRDFLNAPQRRAVEQILKSTDRVSILSGAAGVGKSTLLMEINEAAKQRGKHIVAIASSSGASRGVLREKDFKDADTIAAFLKSRDLQKKSRNNIVLVDEASLVGVRTMNKIFDTCRKNNARVILSGDIAQHAGPESGDALRLLQEKSGLPVIHVDKILRQRHNPAYKKAIEALAKGRTKDGFDRLDEMKAIIEIEDPAERHTALARAAVDSIANNRKPLIVSPTHAEGALITKAVRDQMKLRGRLGTDEQSFIMHRPLSFTAAQKQDAAQYEPGMVVQFHQNVKGIKAGDGYEIIGQDKKGKLRMRSLKEKERELDLPLSMQERFQVFRPDIIQLAAGDRLRITHNGRTMERTRIHNGQVHTVAGFTEGGDIRLSSGKTLPKDFAHFNYGFVQTSHAAQGKDARDVFIAQSALSFAATNQKTFYVSASRGTERVMIFTDDKKALRAAIRKSGDRISAGDIAKSHARQIKMRQRHYALTTQSITRDEQTRQQSKDKLAHEIYRPELERE